MKTEHYILKVKEGKLHQWKEWCAYLREHKEEVLETLRNENVVQESATLYSHNNEHYLHVVMVDNGHRKSSDKLVDLNRRHAEMIEECLEDFNEGEVLFDFQTT